MRKLVMGTVCLVLAAMSARAADLREPYDPEAYRPPPQAYGPPPEPDDEPPVHRPARPPVPPIYGYRETPPFEAYRERPPAWREARPRDERWDEPRWREGGWHQRRHHDDDCRIRPTPWGPERVCR